MSGGSAGTWVVALVAGGLSVACQGGSDVRSTKIPDPFAGDGDMHVPPALDPPLPAPNCGGQLAPGQTRAIVGGIIGRVAIDAEGNVYTPFASESGELGLEALDPCGELLWQNIVASSLPMHPTAARLIAENEVILEALSDFDPPGGIWRFERTGEPLPPLPLEGRYYSWIGADGTAIYLDGYLDGHTVLSRVTPSDEVTRPTEIAADEEECAVFGARIGCYLGTFRTDTLEAVWSKASIPIIDGTMRHAVNPALTDDRLYGLVYGVSTYRVVAQSLNTGESVWSDDLDPSPSGQSGLVTGGAVVGENGWVYFYVAHRKDAVLGPITGDFQPTIQNEENYGWLIAYDDKGNERWRLDAPSMTEQYREHATHLAGRGGVIYLATTVEVWALDGTTGEVLWTRSDLSQVWTPRIALSPNGDLLVQSNPNQLMYLATGNAGGTADSMWPAPGGDRRNRNAR